MYVVFFLWQTIRVVGAIILEHHEKTLHARNKQQQTLYEREVIEKCHIGEKTHVKLKYYFERT